MDPGRHHDSSEPYPRPGADRFFPGALLLVGLATVVLAMRYRLGQSLTMDEPFMATMIRKPWSELWQVFPIDNIPLFYVALKAWAAVWGDSEFALRSLSALAYGGAAVVTGRAARLLGGRSAGLAAAVLMAGSVQVGIESAATARPYAVLALIAAAAVWLSVGLLMRPGEAERPPKWPVPVLAVIHLAGCFTHPTYVVVAAACAGASLVNRRASRSGVLVAPVLAVSGYGLVWGVMIRRTLQLGTTDWMRPPTVADVQYVLSLVWGTGPSFMLLGALLVVLLGGGRRLYPWIVRVEVRWSVAFVLLAWTAVIAGSHIKPIFWVRTPMMLLPGTCVIVTALLARGAGRAVPLAVAALVAMAGAARIAAIQPGDPSPSRESLSVVLSRADCGDVVIAPGMASHTAEYYFRRLRAPDCIELIAFPADPALLFGNWSRRVQDPLVVAALHDDARQVADAVTGRTVWLLRLTDWETREATTIIEQALRRPCSEPEPLRGAFFDDVRQCRVPEGERGVR